jgi:hypothetical protein
MTVAIVYLEDGRELNLELIKAGVAWHFKRYSDDPRYAEAEIQARKAGIGLWRDGNAIAPWGWRRNQRGANEGRVSSLSGYHGNVGSRVFHGANCRHFNCKNCIRQFSTREEAIGAGYRPCGSCQP